MARNARADGIHNTYALAMSERRARDLGVRTISDHARHPQLRAGFPAEFLGRRDGYPGLARTYGLRFARAPASLEAGLMYEAVAEGRLDVIAAYATDGRIAKFALRVLADDRAFFPPYQAAPLLGKLRDAAHARCDALFAAWQGVGATPRWALNAASTSIATTCATWRAPTSACSRQTRAADEPLLLAREDAPRAAARAIDVGAPK